MTIKMIAIDIDGTLLNEKNELAPATIEAVQAAKAQGIKVVLCTGRPLTGVQPYLDALGISGDDQYAITYNGSVSQTVSGKMMTNHSLSFDDYIDLEALARKMQVHFQIETPDFIYTNRTSVATHLRKLPGTHADSYREVGEMDRVYNHFKAMFVDDPDIINRVKEIPKMFATGTTWFKVRHSSSKS